MGKELVDKLSVMGTSLGAEHLLGVPISPSGSGKRSSHYRVSDAGGM
jgi:hypothetical protein